MRRSETNLQYQKVILLFILLIALLPRFLLLPRATQGGLGIDELQSAIHANLPLDQLLKSVQTFDPHPPLFYIQLHVWEKFGTGDSWLRLNTILWIVLAAFSLWHLGGKLFGFQVGAIASILFALSPISVVYSLNLRMYAFLIFLSIWTWYFTHQFFHTEKRWITGTGILLSTLAFLYSQGAGFLILPSGFMYALLISAKSWRRNVWVFVKYLIVQVVIVVLYTPWLLRARTIHLAHPLKPGLSDITTTFSQLLFGTLIVRSRYLDGIMILATVLFSLVLVILLIHVNSRKIGVSFIIIPLATCFVVSHLLEPIWLTRSLVQVTPFISLCLAIIVGDWIRDRRLIPAHRTKFMLEMSIAGVMAIGSVIGLVYHHSQYYPWSPLKESATFIRKNFKPADVVYFPNVRMYWGWSWYFFGPGHVQPLTTNYRMAQDGLTVISNPTVATLSGGVENLWIVYSDVDVPGSIYPTGVISTGEKTDWKFNNVTVEKLSTRSTSLP